MLKRLCFWITLFFLFSSCVSTPPPETTFDTSEGTAILPSTSKRALENYFSPYFSTVDSNILLLVQNGSPVAIKEAVALLRKSSKNYSEQEKVLLAMCASIIKYAWPLEKITWDIPSDMPDNVYTSTLASIDRGIYENDFEGSDFFSLTLPSLLLLSFPAVSNYYTEAQNSLKKSISLDPESVLALYLAGILNIRMENYDDAAIYLKNAWDLDVNNMNIVYSFLGTLLKSGKAAEAFDFGTQLISAHPLDMELLKLYAEAAFDIGDYAIAEPLVAQILQREPDNLSFSLLRARILFQLQEYFTVSTLLDVYARTDKTNKDYLLLHSQLQSVWNKNSTAARRTIEEALTLYPNDTDIILLAAELALTTGQTILGNTPADLLILVLEKDPENVRALEISVKEAVAKTNWQTAYNASSLIAQSSDLSLEQTIIHTEICIELNLLDEARQTIETFYTPNTTDENLQQWYIRLLISEGKNTEAKSLIARLLPISTGKMESALYFERSRLATTDSQILSDLRSSLNENPRNEFSLYGMYAYYYDRKDYSKAQFYLKQVIALNPSDIDFLQRNAELEGLL